MAGEIREYADLKADYYRGITLLELHWKWDAPPTPHLPYLEGDLKSAIAALFGTDAFAGEDAGTLNDEPRAVFEHALNDLKFEKLRLWLDDSPGRLSVTAPFRIIFTVTAAGSPSPFVRAAGGG